MIDDDRRARKVARERGGLAHVPPRRLQVVGQAVALEQRIAVAPARIAHRAGRAGDDCSG